MVKVIEGHSRSNVENIRDDARDPRELVYDDGSGLRDQKKFKVTQGQMSETSGMMSGSHRELGNAYVTGLRDEKVKVTQGQILENVWNRLGTT
jgi:hypothetical protein